MQFSWTLVIALLAQKLTVLAVRPAKRTYDTHDYYVLEHDPPANSSASLADVARALGVEVVEQAGQLQDHWLVRTEKRLTSLAARGEPHDRVIDTLQRLIARVSAEDDSPLLSRSEDVIHARQVVSSIRYLSRQVLRQRVKRSPPPIRPFPNYTLQSVSQEFGIRDPLFDIQWHLVNSKYPPHMMNVIPLWQMNFTGKGVISALVDDGLDYTSDDLAANFDAINSYDYNDHEDLPTPKKAEDHHGTRCAGQIAAIRNNVCGVGIAYDSKVAGIRILSKPITDVDESAALNHGYQNISVYSCSWGPPDNGKAMSSPGYLIKKAVLNGINNGRGGKGSVFVFASGNGAAHGDQCNFDGYTNSIYSVTVGAVDYKGLHPYYSEACAANMIVAYSSGSGNFIVTTDKGKNECTHTHGGTSAAAPNVAAVFALTIQARPDLTWRDFQYLCVETAQMINPNDPDWERTATGKLYSYKYGFGVLDAYIFVKAAQKWKLVKPQAWLEPEAIQLNRGTMNEAKNFTGGQFMKSGGIKSKLTVTKAKLIENNFEILEHINVQVWISHTRRGDVEVELVSPHGIRSVLGGKRAADEAKTGYPGWVFMSVKHWGEDPVGDWTIKVSDQNNPKKANGTFHGWSMKFWGSCIDPSKAKKYELPLVDDVLPPTHDPARPIIEKPTVTTTHSRPTAHLPGSHGTDEGENTIPAYPSSGEGVLTDMATLVSSHRSFFGGTAVVALFSIGAGVFFWRRRTARSRLKNYTTIPGEDVSMSILGRDTAGDTCRTRELYRAFDEGGDDDAPSPGRHPKDRAPVGLGFHSAFLDDDELSTAGVGQAPKYRDEPEEMARSRAVGPREEGRTASPSASGDGSWEHAT